MQLIITTSSDPGRAALASSYFNRIVNPAIACAIAAVLDPTIKIPAEIRTVFDDPRIGRFLIQPARLTAQLAGHAAAFIQVGAPATVIARDGVPVDVWDVADPSGKRIEEIRALRDRIKSHVTEFLRARCGWLKYVCSSSDRPGPQESHPERLTS